MKVLESWLKEFAPFEAPPTQMAEDLAELGLSVEALTQLGSKFTGVVVAKVAELKPHPDADRIQLVEVDVGNDRSVQVCCGAFNMSVGDLVPLASVGAVLPNGMEIGKRKMRGEWSEGMLCAPDELELGADIGGIMILPDGLFLGQDLREALELENDFLFDIEVNPNRPDAMSVMGVARDLAAKQGLPFALFDEPRFEESGTPASELTQIEIREPDFCRHFYLRVLTDFQIQASSAKIANRLLACGMRPLNNIVDISNYVMLELGQPTHSFDLDKLPEGYLGVRMADQGEKLQTLDGETRELTTADGVIVDVSNQAISIAGIMGGASTEISDSTQRVVVEAAWWKPINIARSSRRLGLRSEASARYERGVDAELAPLALNRIAELAQEFGTKVAPGINQKQGNLEAAPKITLRTSQIERQLGVPISSTEAAELLNSIGFSSEPPSGGPDSDLLEVQVPSFRPDTTLEVDLIEEIARTYGYSRIPRRVPRSKEAGGLTPRQLRRRQVADILKGFGLLESISLPFFKPGEIERMGADVETINISNSSVTEESVMRPFLGLGLLKNLSYNASHQNYGVELFEMGKVFLANPSKSSKQELPHENEHLGIAMAGADIFRLTACVRGLIEGLGMKCVIKNETHMPGFHPVRGGSIHIKSADPSKTGEDAGTSPTPKTDANIGIGVLGEVDPQICADLNISERVVVAELFLEALLDLEIDRPAYLAPSKYPATNFDLAFWVDKAVSADELGEALLEAARQAMESESVEVKLFDVFAETGSELENEPSNESRRSLAYSIKLQSSQRTLTDEEAGAVREKCIQAAASIGAKARI